MRILSSALAMCLVVLAVGNLMADDPAPPNTTPSKRGPRMGMGPLEFIQGLDLTDDQKAKLSSLREEYRPKFKETSEKMAALYTPEQKQALKDALKSLRGSGKDPQEIRKAIEEAVKPTPEQQTKMAEIRKEIEGVQKELREKVMALLTPEQKEMVEKKIKEKESGSDSKKPADTSK
jgi:Spy/CpxP family protein refolding chaperone